MSMSTSMSYGYGFELTNMTKELGIAETDIDYLAIEYYG